MDQQELDAVTLALIVSRWRALGTGLTPEAETLDWGQHRDGVATLLPALNAVFEYPLDGLDAEGVGALLDRVQQHTSRQLVSMLDSASVLLWAFGLELRSVHPDV